MRLFLFMLPLVLLGLLGCKRPSPTPAAYRQITPREAMEELETAEDFILLDVRTQAEFESGHIPGAICIPNETIGTQDIPALPRKEQSIYIYCRSGNRSKQAAAKLARLGYTNLIEFGGILEWPGEIVTE